MHRDIRHVLFYVPLKPGGNLLLVESNRNTILVLRDDRPLEGFEWPSDQIADAVTEFQKLKTKALAIQKPA
jgi:hypothetical protein